MYDKPFEKKKNSKIFGFVLKRASIVWQLKKFSIFSENNKFWQEMNKIKE